MENQDLGPVLKPQSLLGALERHGVDYIVIGGLAGIAHGSSHPTFDLDVAYARDGANLRRMADALQELGVRLRGAPPDLPLQVDSRTLANGSNFTFETDFGDFDILADIAGARSYQELREASRPAEIDGLAVRIVSIDDLIAMKRAANRPKDRNMLEEYIVIADEQRRLEEESEPD
jgi:hypothetical protein